MSDRRPNVSEMSNYQVNGNNAFRAETQSAPIQQEINPSTQKSQVLFDSENIQGRTDNIVYVDFQGGQEKSISEVQAISNEQNEQAEARKAILRAKILEFNDKLDVPQPHQVEVANSTENNIVTPSNHTEDICKAFNGEGECKLAINDLNQQPGLKPLPVSESVQNSSTMQQIVAVRAKIDAEKQKQARRQHLQNTGGLRIDQELVDSGRELMSHNTSIKPTNVKGIYEMHRLKRAQRSYMGGRHFKAETRADAGVKRVA